VTGTRLTSFAGVGNRRRPGDVPGGTVVLDGGCGSGADLLPAARLASDTRF